MKLVLDKRSDRRSRRDGRVDLPGMNFKSRCCGQIARENEEEEEKDYVWYGPRHKVTEFDFCHLD